MSSAGGTLRAADPPRPEALAIRGRGAASDYAAALLGDVGWPVRRVDGLADPHPDLAWAASGAMALTGRPEGPPRLAPGPLASAAEGARRAFEALVGQPLPFRDGAALLGERAAIAGLRRGGQTAPGGHCRLIEARNAWVALSLARPEDRASLAAWLEADLPDAPGFDAIAAIVAGRSADVLQERARWLGLPFAIAGPPPAHPGPWLRRETHGQPLERPLSARPVVVDVSGLWAGPLCTHLLHLAGARVLKVESATRPDGARGGPTAFFDLLNAGKQCVVLDLRQARGRDTLHALMRRADVVVESARPRALAQLGIEAERLVAEEPGKTWVSLTGYGRRDPAPGRVAFGDDAAVAAGLAHALGRGGPTPLFCADAIADPLAGLHAAVAALASFRAGGGELLDVALRDVTSHAAAFDAGATRARVEEGAAGTRVVAGDAATPVRPPRARAPSGRARPLGADTSAVLAELGLRC